jgi:hypothetical protein
LNLAAVAQQLVLGIATSMFTSLMGSRVPAQIGVCVVDPDAGFTSTIASRNWTNSSTFPAKTNFSRGRRCVTNPSSICPSLRPCT